MKKSYDVSSRTNKLNVLQNNKAPNKGIKHQIISSRVQRFHSYSYFLIRLLLVYSKAEIRLNAICWPIAVHSYTFVSPSTASHIWEDMSCMCLHAFEAAIRFQQTIGTTRIITVQFLLSPSQLPERRLYYDSVQYFRGINEDFFEDNSCIFRPNNSDSVHCRHLLILILVYLNDSKHIQMIWK